MWGQPPLAVRPAKLRRCFSRQPTANKVWGFRREGARTVNVVDKICQAFSSSVRFLERIQALELLSFPPGVAGVRLMSGDLETGRHRRWQANCQ